MRWNRRFSLASLSLSGWFTTATGARNICRFATASGWVRPVSSRRWYTDDTYDNALAETINRLYKTELIHKRGPWKSIESGVGKAEIGDLVQSSAPSEANWK